MNTVCLTDRGKVRQHNEDNCGVFLNRDGDTLAIVADGMGGHRAGDVASKMAIDNLQALWEKTSNINSPEAAENWLKTHIQQVNEILFNHSQNNNECQGMGTTIVGAICTMSFSTIAHIGDSRCYILNNEGFKQITEDHSLVNELLRSGQISKEDAEHHPRKNVLLRALGTEQNVEMDIKTIILEENDLLVLCTDGLTNKLTNLELQEKLEMKAALPIIANELIGLANEKGGEDNITVVIVDFSSKSESW